MPILILGILISARSASAQSGSAFDDLLGANGPAAVTNVQSVNAVPVPDDTAAEGRVILKEKLSAEVQAAFEKALTNAGRLPAGVDVIVSGGGNWADNPLIEIYVDGRIAYYQYLYHAEEDLAYERRTWKNPKTWLIPSKPSADVSKRFEAAFALAKEGAPVVRAKRGEKQGR